MNFFLYFDLLGAIGTNVILTSTFLNQNIKPNFYFRCNRTATLSLEMYSLGYCGKTQPRTFTNVYIYPSLKVELCLCWLVSTICEITYACDLI